MLIFAHGKEKKLLAEINMASRPDLPAKGRTPGLPPEIRKRPSRANLMPIIRHADARALSAIIEREAATSASAGVPWRGPPRRRAQGLDHGSACEFGGGGDAPP